MVAVFPKLYQYYIIFPNKKVYVVTDQLLGMPRVSCRNLPTVQNWVLKRVQSQTPAEIEDIAEFYAYDS